MSDYYLVVVDTVGIQPYIFGSNRLRENVGASYLVHMATGGWLYADPPHFLPPGDHNIRDGKRVDNLPIEADEQRTAELLYAGGGNLVLLFRSPEGVRRFGRALSCQLLTEAPGLDAVLVERKFHWVENPEESDILAAVLECAMKDLAVKKASREPNHPLLGLGVTAACNSTGLVANYHAPEQWEEQPEQRRLLSISAEVAAKWDNNIPAKERLRKELFPDDKTAIPETFDFPDEFDDLGRTEGEISYIGVVHADGNDFGKRFKSITEEYKGKSPSANREYIARLRQFSDEANDIGLYALQKVVAAVAQWNQRGQELAERKQKPRPGEMALAPAGKNGKALLSIRPIVFGGDDVTFVCDGRIALQAAQIFLEEFARRKINGKPATAGAGVAIVKVRYPFARAYQLAESLTKNAKQEYGRDVSALDWHLAQSGLFGSLADIRAYEYQAAGRSLLMRPLVVSDLQNEWRTWGNYVSILQQFQRRPGKDDSSGWPRNKVMALRGALRQSLVGGERVSQEFIGQLPKKLPAVQPARVAHQETGWDGNRCIYFDAIEMIEQMVAYDNKNDEDTPREVNR